MTKLIHYNSPHSVKPLLNQVELPNELRLIDGDRELSQIKVQKKGLLSRDQVIDDRYKVCAMVAHGSSSEIYVVEDQLLSDQILALKLVDGLVTKDPRTLGAIQQELLTNRTLRHPNILQLYNASFGDSMHEYLTMEYVNGCSLLQLLQGAKTSPLSIEEAIYIFVELAAGISYAHQQSVIHHNLTLDRALISRQGDVRLRGCGRPQVLGRRVLHSEGFRGVFNSPEQSDGTIDHLGNQYSLGIILFSLLAGVDHVAKVVRPELLSDMRSVRAVPTWVAELINTCTQIDRDKRFDSVEQALIFLEAQVDIDTIEEAARFGLQSRVQDLRRVSRKKRTSSITKTRKTTRFRPSTTFQLKKSK